MMSTTGIGVKGDDDDKHNDIQDSSVCYTTSPSTIKNIMQNGGIGHRIESENNVFDENNEKGTLSIDNVAVNDHNQTIVTTNDHPLVAFPPQTNSLQVVSANTLDDNNGTSTIYLLVSSDSTNPVLQPVNTRNQVSDVQVDIVPDNTIKPINTENHSTSPLLVEGNTQQQLQDGTLVQVMNSDGVPINLNVNDLLNSLSSTRNSTYNKKDTIPGILNLSNAIISTTENNPSSLTTNHNKDDQISQNFNGHFLFDSSSPVNHVTTNVPNWALHLQDCTLYGDTYTGFVTNENEMDIVLNLYKKETQSLFAIRQTPSLTKDESVDTVRLMWKSQYVPYDGIPFINVGRRATVMECEHGPRKRSNALKRMAQMHSYKKNLKKIPNLTCPARLFVKKVKKFPQYRVPLEADAKVVRTLQEQSLKLVRQTGGHTGEIRLYMQLPLPSAHKYHHIGNSVEMFLKEMENLDNVLVDEVSVDSRVLEKIQEIVRQGYMNPFLVRSAAKDFVENQMLLNVNEPKPYKHNKTFYPALIEIQNIIQQTDAAISCGLLTPLPKPDTPPVPVRSKRKRSATVASSSQSSPLLIKRVKVDIPEEEASKEIKIETSSKDALDISDQPDTIALTLTDSQLENFSVTNFSYDQLAQLAKIGLIALNNATKDGEGSSEKVSGDTVPHQTISTRDGESILVVTPNNAEEEKARLQVLASGLNTSGSAFAEDTENVSDG